MTFFFCSGNLAENDLHFYISKIHSTWNEENEDDGIEATIKFSEPTNKLILANVFEKQGHVPLPPYLKREAEMNDKESYQTVYAKKEGSVAAPTAGLHFTNEIIQNLKSNGAKCSSVCLHVSAGTFRPIDAENVANHEMHEECFSVDSNTIKNIIESIKLSRPIVPVGTTSVRVLETLYWLGVLRLLESNKDNSNIFLDQWDPFKLERSEKFLPSAVDALSCLVDTYDIVEGSTKIMIVPGYKFRLCDALITNFHQPHSTLMFLVAALFKNEDDCLKLYEHAVQERYNFLSYGDSNFIINENSVKPFVHTKLKEG